MPGVPLNEVLWQRLNEMVEFELDLQAAVKTIDQRVREYEPAAELMEDIERAVADHLIALRERIETGDRRVMPLDPVAAANSDTPKLKPAGQGDIHLVSRALASLYGTLNSVLIRYSIIQPMSHRVRDSGTIAKSGTTAHLTRAHMQDYMGLVGRINEMLHNAVLWELDTDGQECGCTCPSCGLGLCVCSVASRFMLNESWAAARPPVAELGLEIQLPREASSARAAGFMRGDVVVAVDDQPVKSTAIVQKTIRDHLPNARIDFEVRRRGDLLHIIAERWCDLGVDADANLDDCVVPAGTEFFVGQAQEARDRLRERVNGRVVKEAGLTDLTTREIQVLRLIAKGADNPKIGDELEIKRTTVARHVANILEKLGATNRAEAATVAAENGLLPRR